MKHRKVAKPEKQYVRGIIHNLSLSRWTDQEIVDYLHDEKRIDLARSTVSKIKNQIEAQAEKWYIELRESRYKYIATYKERLDSLFSYQRKLHEILAKMYIVSQET
jgi:Rps23 Pro-64 3,4-dihydroxylase Tpa1-like proline 4-hydroxylase